MAVDIDRDYFQSLLLISMSAFYVLTKPMVMVSAREVLRH